MKNLSFMSLGVVASLLIGSANATDFSSQVEVRQSAFLSMADNLRTMKKLEDGRDSDWEKIKTLALENAKIMVELPTMFPEGSVEGSKSKASVWSKWDKFESGLHSLEQNYEAMVIAANEQDPKALTSAIKSADRSCKSCHRSFKAKW
ncbi:cytochrome c [Enterovibrio sp. ZSDZ35]|uniref:Cytochrome c n=1 Tax=Enterovibrio qingdaonensis TaxID=2899818 RepID=A0ABT5QNJ0_9GAMM|nr:cytochrome c [Enterovibrio sp. ZSDZ35]MDD1782563.1 cytochrome c [Enterovibrio sp. ZSDZ35]